jgi:hypothetical protein
MTDESNRVRWGNYLVFIDILLTADGGGRNELVNKYNELTIIGPSVRGQ